MWASIIGLIGVIAGVVLNELIRRSRRIETFSSTIFEKRLEKYEELMSLLQRGYDVASEVMENPDYSSEERHALISEAILNIARYTDKEALYIDSDLGAHCVSTFMSAEDVISIENLKDREEATQRIRNMYSEAKRMIRELSGVQEVEKLFVQIHRPRITSPIIDRIRYLKAHPEELEKLTCNKSDD